MNPAKKADWNHAYVEDRDYQWTTTSHLAHILRTAKISPPASVLDVGCGTGQLCRDLYHRGYIVTGMDSSTEAIDLAKRSTVVSEELSFQQSDVMDYSPGHELFDIIVCKYTLVFMNDMDEFIKHTRTLLNPDGVLIIINPDQDSLPACKRHITVKHDTMLQNLAKTYDSITSERIANEYYYYARTDSN